MIGNNRIGCNGRLGNQMFQYASMRGIALLKDMIGLFPQRITSILQIMHYLKHLE